MLDTFKSISLSHKTAPLWVRELIALNEEEAKRLMLRLRDFFGLSDLLVVSTCNRTEVYYAFEQDLNAEIARLLLIEKGLTDTDQYLPYFQFYAAHSDAVLHLFEVCVGLHSQVVGDMQIPNQVKQSYQWSADLDMAGPFLHRLMHTIFFTNKRVAQETAFRDGAASVSYAAVDLIDELVGENQNPNVLVIGLGEIGADVCMNLESRNMKNITLCNRTQAKAEALAQKYGFRVADFANLMDEISRADVIISSVMRDEPLITPAFLQGLNVLTYKYFIDLSVPRSVDAAVEQIPGVLAYNIDHIRNRADEALNQRLAAIPQVEAIIGQAVAEFGDWTKEMVVSPTINKLKNALEQIRKDEIARHLKHLTPDESEKVDKITRGIMQKIIKLPVLQLKAACKRGEAETLIDVLNDLFDLEKQSVDEYKH
ncbi:MULTISPECIES: glutamyl-tRNA reductase [Spirosoma]|uniref:Glutamyl-tRNA reductase n=1 Tax=Spirosoma liriopis TaxID=2937440 RepID=A0ABT0HGP5_9BACT|nr:MULTISPECIES: glutamyl-tRNA reductase [Spirosoma]MCK8491341.1 glutamyl-tRNA reductase [Spirosoma liriopis]UHG90712.1 glutamyl-tRNA reductase [Spirosoma oryzicola]